MFIVVYVLVAQKTTTLVYVVVAKKTKKTNKYIWTLKRNSNMHVNYFIHAIGFKHGFFFF